MQVDVYTQDESLVRAITDRLEPVDHLCRPHLDEGALSSDADIQTLLIVDSRTIDKARLGPLFARSTSLHRFSLIIVGAPHEMREWEHLTSKGNKTDFLVWPSPGLVLGNRFNLIRNHLARLSLPRSVDLAPGHHGGPTWEATEWIPLMIIVAGPLGSAYLVNAAMRRFLGEDQVRHQESLSWLQWIHPDDRAETMKGYAAAVAMKRFSTSVVRMKRFDGEWRQLRVVGAPVFDQDASFAGFVATLEDVTEELTLAEKLRDSESMYRELAESVPLKINVLKPDGTSMFNNSAFRAFYPDAIDMDPKTWKHVHPDDMRTAEEHLADWAQGVEHTFELRLRAPGTETYFWHRIFNTPIRNAQGAMEGWILSSMNVDEEKRQAEEIKRLYRELSQESRAKRDFLAVLSHELRTPLNIILGYCSLLEEVPALNDDQRSALVRIVKDARALLSEVEKLPWPEDTLPDCLPDFVRVVHVD